MREKMAKLLIISFVLMLLMLVRELIIICDECLSKLSGWTNAQMAIAVVLLLIASHYFVEFGKRIIDKIVGSD